MGRAPKVGEVVGVDVVAVFLDLADKIILAREIALAARVAGTVGALLGKVLPRGRLVELPGIPKGAACL